MMSTLPKSLTIAFLAISIFISGLNIDFVGAQITSTNPATTQSLADPLKSRYIKFGRLTAEDGLSNVQNL